MNMAPGETRTRVLVAQKDVVPAMSLPDLHNPEERFRLLVDSVVDYAIFMLEPDGRIASWNAGAERMKGYTAADAIGRHFSIFYPPEDQAAGKPRRGLERAETEGRAEDEGCRVRKDGSRFWSSVVITAMRNPAGRLIGFAKVIRDLTERGTAAEQFRSRDEEFRMLVERVEEYAIYLLGPTGTIVTWNAGAQKIKGYSAQQIIGQNFACFYTYEDVAAGKPQHNLQQAARLGHISEQGTRVRQDGSRFQAEVVITALRDEAGTLSGFSKVTRDLTEQIRTREIESEKIASERANRAKDEFLAALSHELRTPLTPVLAAASFLVDHASQFPAEFAADLDVIKRNVLLQARLIDDLLDLTRISAGKITLQRDCIDAHAVAAEALKMARLTIVEKQLNLAEDWSATKHHISGDAVRVQQVFWNLISNALKFTAVGGQIFVRTSNGDGRFHFEISDNGIGIDPARQKDLFRAFEQGGSGITRQFGGLGLGLAICKNLVEVHGGTIELFSRGRGLGTTVKVSFDVLRDIVRADPAPPASPLAVSLRIVFVEDHVDTRQVLGRLLKRCGHEVLIAGNVHDATELLRRHAVDVVLSDIGLPDGTGHDVIAAAKQIQDVTGIALTGFGMVEDVRRCKEAGFDFHLTKPVDFAELRALLQKIGTAAERSVSCCATLRAARK